MGWMLATARLPVWHFDGTEMVHVATFSVASVPCHIPTVTVVLSIDRFVGELSELLFVTLGATFALAFTFKGLVLFLVIASFISSVLS